MTMTALAIDLGKKITRPSERVVGSHIEEIVAALDLADNVYLVLENTKSRYLWVNENVANLVGMTPTELIGTKDMHEEHVKHHKILIVL